MLTEVILLMSDTRLDPGCKLKCRAVRIQGGVFASWGRKQGKVGKKEVLPLRGTRDLGEMLVLFSGLFPRHTLGGNTVKTV